MRIHLALLLTAVLFSINYIISKVAMKDFGPLPFAWLRVAGSFLLLSALVPFMRKSTLSRFEPRDYFACAAFSVLGVVVNQLMFLGGLARTSAHEAAILITSIPIFVLLTGALLQYEKVTLAKIAGILLGCAGAIVIIAKGAVDHIPGSFTGNVMIIVNCLSYSVYLVVSRPMYQKAPAMRVLRVIFGFGTVLMLPFCFGAVQSLDWRAVPSSSWWALAVVIAGPTVGAYAISGWALARADSSTVAVYTYLQPVFATIMAAIFLDERLSALVAIGGGLIVSGVFVSTMKRKSAVNAEGGSGV